MDFLMSAINFFNSEPLPLTHKISTSNSYIITLCKNSTFVDLNDHFWDSKSVCIQNVTNHASNSQSLWFAECNDVISHPCMFPSHFLSLAHPSQLQQIEETQWQSSKIEPTPPPPDGNWQRKHSDPNVLEKALASKWNWWSIMMRNLRAGGTRPL